MFGALVGDQAPITPRRSATSEGAAPGALEEERGSVRRFLSPDPGLERPATKAAFGHPEPELRHQHLRLLCRQRTCLKW